MLSDFVGLSCGLHVRQDIFIKPFAEADHLYDYSQARLHTQVASKASTVFKHLESFKPLVESLFIDRLIAGHYWMMKNSGVQAAFKNELEDYLR